MTDVKAALTALGWRVDTPARLAQAIGDFQRMWNLGPALTVTGTATAATRAALDVSLDRHNAKKPDISEHFSAREFACRCDTHGGPWPDCRRIWTPRSTVQLAEKFRSLVGPFSPERGCRCPRENDRVAGAQRSQHLQGRGLDVPVYAITVSQLQAAGIGANGIGYYSQGSRKYVRHIDNRGTNVVPWSYGKFKKKTALALMPSTDTDTPEEDDMADYAAQLNRIEKGINWLTGPEGVPYNQAQARDIATKVVRGDSDNLTAADLTSLIPDEIAQQVIVSLVARLATTSPLPGQAPGGP